ncbi:MAG: glycosyltransferase family 2 protein, partial [Spirochaetaceae bacterium]
MQTLSVIVVSYNTRDLTRACLESVYRETALLDFEVIVVDNASEDGSADMVRAEFPQARLLALEE